MSSLQGATVLVTRPVHQAENLSQLIASAGGLAVRFPTLEIAKLTDSEAEQVVSVNLATYDWLVFISANAVTMHGYYSDSDRIKKFKSLRIAAIGKSTALALNKAGYVVDLLAENGANSEALLAMPELAQVNGQRFLIIRGQGGREELANVLRSRGASVDYLDVYKRVMPSIDNAKLLELLKQQGLDIITITSAEAVQNLLKMVGESCKQHLLEVPLVVVSQRIRKIAAEIGFKRIAVAESPSDIAILDTVIMSVTGGECGRSE